MVPVSKPRQAEVTIGCWIPAAAGGALGRAAGGGRAGPRRHQAPVRGRGGRGRYGRLRGHRAGAEGSRAAGQGLSWTLSKVTKSFQWYQVDGRWDYEPVVSRQRVASGMLDLGKPAGRIEAGVDWGGYELAIRRRDGGALPASIGFEAGWYQAPGAFDTPDLLKVSLDKEGYRIGETARVRIEPRFPGWPWSWCCTTGWSP